MHVHNDSFLFGTILCFYLTDVSALKHNDDPFVDLYRPNANGNPLLCLSSTLPQYSASKCYLALKPRLPKTL